MKSTSIGYVLRDNHSKVVMKKRKKIGDCVISVTECLVVRDAILKIS